MYAEEQRNVWKWKRMLSNTVSLHIDGRGKYEPTRRVVMKPGIHPIPYPSDSVIDPRFTQLANVDQILMTIAAQKAAARVSYGVAYRKPPPRLPDHYLFPPGSRCINANTMITGFKPSNSLERSRGVTAKLAGDP
jgi:hypothetical protein